MLRLTAFTVLSRVAEGEVDRVNGQMTGHCYCTSSC